MIVTALCAVVGMAAWPATDDRVLSPADAVAVAAKDVAKVAAVDPERAYCTRYFTAFHLSPAERIELKAVMDYHVNGLSTKPELVRLREVNPWLWAADIRDYGWDRLTFGTLASGKNVEPYFHVQTLAADGKSRVNAGAPWVPANDLAYLIATTGSQTPVVRADWFLYRTAMQEGRNEAGYYDFLKLKSRKDAEKLARLRRADAEEIFREQAAVIEDSGVALQGRQLFRYATVTGAWWESRDVKAETDGRDDKNPVRRLLDDYKHDAEEIVFTLPNRLPAYYLSGSDGKGVDSAPPDIASDNRSPNNDKRVHPGLSCIRCHGGNGLIPFDDLFRGRFDKTLRAADKDKEQRLRSVYLGPIYKAFERDKADFGDAVQEACGLSPAALSTAYARQFFRYNDERVTVDRAAKECGVGEDVFVERVRAYALAQSKTAGVIDPVLALYASPNPRGMRRTNFEELMPVLMIAVTGGK